MCQTNDNTEITIVTGAVTISVANNNLDGSGTIYPVIESGDDGLSVYNFDEEAKTNTVIKKFLSLIA